MAKHHQIGQHGEQLASTYLQAQGYEIIERNWRCPYGEIDLVARLDDVTIFCEVKTRRGTDHNALASLTPHKRERLLRSAQWYSHQNDINHWRIDAIGILMKTDDTHQINHVEDALDW